MEQWRDVVEYEGYYQVSNLGNIRSVDRVVARRKRAIRLKGRVRKLCVSNQYGHLGLRLHKKGKAVNKRVHQIVAEAWLGPCPPGHEVCHGPEGLADNSIGNLCYGTRKQNSLDARRDGTDGGRRVTRSDGRVFPSLHVAAEESGCDYRNIWKCCNGQQVTSGGYGWKYHDE